MFKKLIHEWVIGNRKHVIDEVLKMPPSMVALFAITVNDHYDFTDNDVAIFLSLLEENDEKLQDLAQRKELESKYGNYELSKETQEKLSDFMKKSMY